MKPLYGWAAFMDEPVPEYSGGIFTRAGRPLFPADAQRETRRNTPSPGLGKNILG
ncbi:MAG: hypothetical protein ACLT8E_00585 [Akkermansia sp.]